MHIKLLITAAAMTLSMGLAQADPIPLQPNSPQLADGASGLIHGNGVEELKISDILVLPGEARESNWAAVSAIGFAEQSNDPIAFSVSYHPICAVEGDVCARRIGLWNMYLREGRRGTVTSHKSVAIGAGRYITGLQVCTNGMRGARAKVKGIRIWGGEVRSNGTVRTFGGAVQARRPNCVSWKSRVNCPNNTVMTGLRVYYSATKGANALRPLCSSVRRASSSNSGVIIQRN